MDYRRTTPTADSGGATTVWIVAATGAFFLSLAALWPMAYNSWASRPRPDTCCGPHLEDGREQVDLR